MREKNVDAAISDLDAVDRLAPKQADLRFVLAERYQAAGRFSAAIAQYDLWIQNHPEDARIAMAVACSENVPVVSTLRLCALAPYPVSCRRISLRSSMVFCAV